MKASTPILPGATLLATVLISIAMAWAEDARGTLPPTPGVVVTADVPVKDGAGTATNRSVDIGLIVP
jgi:hypothetical protein